MKRILAVKRCFDGEKIIEGPLEIVIEGNVFRSIRPGSSGAATEKYDFIMPPMAESHCHLFLDGEELDPGKRKAHLAKSFEELVAAGRENLERYRKAGITVIRDAGDSYGVNHRLRSMAGEMGMTVISAGKAVRKTGRYGSFMAREVAGEAEIPAAVNEIAESSDTLKIVLTGIIDFANGKVKGDPQFTLAELSLLVKCAKDHDLKTFVHCSGTAGLELAVAAGVDSIEHGFFMTPELLRGMAEKRIAWVPTFIPVEFQAVAPQYAGWDAPTVEKLRAILDNHARCLALAMEYGVPVMAGSDGGSFGVRHGAGLLEELRLMRRAGMSEEQVLFAAVAAPRRHFRLSGGLIRPGETADFITGYPLA